MKKVLLPLILSLIAVITIGCGNSDPDVFVANGSNVNGATTGNLVFNFVQAQTTTVPTTTTDLRFDFFAAGGVLVISETRPFAAQVIFEGVPDSVVRVEVTALDANGFPLLLASGDVNVIANTDVTVNLTTAPITLDSLTVTPESVTIVGTNTAQLVLQGMFSNGLLLNLNASQAAYTDNNVAVATVSDSGLITGVAAGTTSVTISFTVNGVTVTDSTDIRVVGPELTLSDLNNTFDTTTGLLNGSAIAGWDGTVLNLAGFVLPEGNTLTVSGGQAFQVASIGDITIDGTVDARGGIGGYAGEDAPGGAGGLAGPGGFIGGEGGGTNVASPNGQDGAGPGAGGGALGNILDGFDTTAGGGGAGHLMAGSPGIAVGDPGPVAGAGGAPYVSIPTSLLGGSGGGGGASEPDSNAIDGDTDGGGGGGGGGGAVRMTATGLLTVGVNGVIDCSGGDGGDSESGAGGGAGSGGSIELLASIAPTINGLLNVAGGQGGPGPIQADGGDASEGRTNVGTI